MSKKSTKKTVGNLAVKEAPVVIENPKPDPTLIEALLANATEANGERYCTLPVKMLEIDYSYQRPANMEVVRKIAANWDTSKVSAPLVSHRDERLYVVDGQHRVKAAALAGVDILMCQVLTQKTRDEEVDIFVNQNVNKTNVSSYDSFYARCSKECDTFALSMKELFDKYHVVYANPHAGQIGRNGKPIPRKPSLTAEGRLGGIETIMKTGECYGLEMVENILSMIDLLNWHVMHNAYSSVILSGLEYAFKDRDPMKVKDKLYRALNNYTPDDVIIKAQSENRSVGRTAAVKAFIYRIVK